jgi:hypothetical protein
MKNEKLKVEKVEAEATRCAKPFVEPSLFALLTFHF